MPAKSTRRASYSGDINYRASASAIAAITVQDFGIAATTATPAAVVPGASTTYGFTLTPGPTGFSSAITLTATGLPAGETYSFSPATVTPGTSATTTVLTVQLAQATAMNRLGEAAGIAAALLLLPFGTSRRSRRLLRQRGLLGVAMFGLLLCGLAGLTGCGTSNGFFGQKQQSYTVTGTSGNLAHSTTVVLNVQ